MDMMNIGGKNYRIVGMVPVEALGLTVPLVAIPARLDPLDIISEELHAVGVPAHIKGYQYLREAIALTVADRTLRQAVTTRLYPAVAAKFDTTPSRVERAMRHSLETAWDRGNPETLYEYFSNTVSAARGKPTNSEFIAMLAERISSSVEQTKQTA